MQLDRVCHEVSSSVSESYIDGPYRCITADAPGSSSTKRAASEEKKATATGKRRRTGTDGTQGSNRNHHDPGGDNGWGQWTRDSRWQKVRTMRPASHWRYGVADTA